MAGQSEPREALDRAGGGVEAPLGSTVVEPGATVLLVTQGQT